MKKQLKCLLMGSLIFASPLIVADEVEDALKESLELYNEGNFKELNETLDYVRSLLSEKKGDILASKCPAEFDGLTRGEPQITSTSMMGGGLIVECRYSADNREVNITYTADSPLVSGMAMMFGNPMLNQGSKMRRFGKQKVMIKYDASRKSGEINGVAGKVMVAISASNCTEEQLMTAGKSVPYGDLSKLP